jgi:PAS domain S-box-containing protein
VAIAALDRHEVPRALSPEVVSVLLSSSDPAVAGAETRLNVRTVTDRYFSPFRGISMSGPLVETEWVTPRKTTARVTSERPPGYGTGGRVLGNGAFGGAEEVVDFIETVLEASTEYSMIGTDLEAKIVLWNLGARRLYGYEPAEIIGQPEEILHTKEDLDSGLPAQIMEAARGTGKWEGTTERRHKSGARFTAKVVVTPLRDRNGEPTGFLVISSDVSEAVGLAREREGTQSYTRSLIECNLDPLIATDADGLITDVNTQTLKVTGRDREELIGSEFKSHFTEPKRAEEGIDLTLRQGKATNYELTVRAKDGRETIVSYNASTLTDDEDRLRVLATARDVTERRRAEEKFRWLLESAHDAMVIVDGNGEIVLTNAHTEKLFGYTREELAGRSFESLTAQRNRDGHPDWGLRKDGTEFPVEISLSPLETEEGVLSTAAIRDITERRAAESKFRGLLESTPDAMVIVNKKGEIMLTNAQTERLFGFTREELVGQPIETLMPERYRDLFTREEVVGQPIEILTPERDRDGQPERRTGFLHDPRPDPMGAGLDLWAIRKDGTEFPVEISFSPLETEEGVLATAAIRDITARMGAESKFRGLLESAPDAMVIVDKRGEIVLANAQTERLFGFTREELVGQPIETLIPERYRDGHPVHRTGLAHESRADSVGAGLDLLGVRKDGTGFPVEISLSPLETEEGVLEVAAIRDTTERKRFETQLRETNVQLETANQAKNRFLASMSHELRTPLNAVLGFTGTILMGLSGPLTDEQTRQLETVRSNGKHLLSIINDLLDLAKIESGKIELNFEQVDCRALLEEIVSGLRPLADEKSIALLSGVPDHPVIVTTDRRALSQILINLASNAIKFTDEGSVRVELSSQRNGGPVTRFSVVDTGMGIEAADLEKLFAAFQQVVSSTTRQSHEGTGLGLYISQRMAQLIRGEIDVASEPGKGSTFVLELQAGGQG